MYRKNDRTGEFDGFALAFGGKLRRDNRWVILADAIPWDAIENKYANLFQSKVGRPALSLRIAFGALLIKERLNISDEETCEQIRENHYLQYFLGYENYNDELPFDPSLMVHFRKRLSLEILSAVNELIIKQEKPEIEKQHKDDDDKGTGNKGTLIADATVAPEAMRFPHDVTTLDEARQKTEQIIDVLHSKLTDGSIKPRTYRRQARKEFLGFIRNRKPKMRLIRRALKKQMQYVERNLRSINELSLRSSLLNLSKKQYRDLLVISEYVRQQRELYKTGELEGHGRLVSICKPHVRAIARGKARAMYEFGAKVSASMVDGFARVERLSWDNFNEGIDLIEMIESYKKRYGHFPEVVCADKIYRNRKNLEYCKNNNIRLSGPKLGRPFKAGGRIKGQKKIEREDEATRVAIEGKFGEAKTCYTLDRIEMRLKETSETAIMMVFIVMNIARVIRARAAALFLFFRGFIRDISALARFVASESIMQAV